VASHSGAPLVGAILEHQELHRVTAMEANLHRLELAGLRLSSPSANY